MTSFDDHKKSIEDQAAYWLVRLSSADCSPADRFAFEAWKQEDSAHERMYFRLQRGNAVVDRHMTDPRIVAMLEDARSTDTSHRLRRIWGLFKPSRAAMVVPVAAAFAFAFTLVMPSIFDRWATGTSPAQDLSSPAIAISEVFETSVGERSTITLADNSTISINTNSRVEVTFSATERLFSLTRGQAFFEVEKDVLRPFVVEAGDHRVVALGTAFDVKLDMLDGVEVTLVEGRVTVAETVTPSAEIASDFRTRGPVELDPGERFVAKANSESEVVTTDTIEETSWRDGKLVFRSRPLASVVDEMNRYSLQRLVLDDDPRVQELIVSGVFNSGGRAASFVRALETLYPLQAERTAEDELTLVWQE